MADDITFRLMLILIVAVFGPIAMSYRLRSQTEEKLDRWQEGTLILFGLRLSAVLCFVSGVAWMIDPQWMRWSSLPIPAWLRWVGVAIAGGTGTLVWWTFHNLGKNLTDTVVTRKDHSFVSSGPYRYVRHPFYLSFALGLTGAGLAMANWFFLLAGLIPFGFIVARTRIEEAKLVERFGVEYQEYMLRVGRFFPRIKR
ncbi:MAG: isoprenylcysteine carboxylmethyltransferase family protein [Planctomycetaceae bacterium]|nr:isoprenylcysteine carboxylmethyltransferase family protein [Planctomycetaceae bacterium]